MIFDVAAAQVQLRVDVGELAENLAWAFGHDVGQHVQPAAMGHAQHDFANPLLAGFFDRQIQQGNQAFRPFQREALGSQKPLLNEFLEDHGAGQAPQNPQLLLARQRQAVFGPFHPVLQPMPDAQIVHVHELHADRAAIGVAQPGENPTQGEHVGPADRVGRKRPIEIRLR